MKFLLIVFGILLTFATRADSKITAKPCSWTPPTNKSVSALQSLKKIEDAKQLPERDKDYLQVAQKGKQFFHSLPDESCKQDIFIVQGDRVQLVETYPKDDGSFNNSWARVVYYSKIFKDDVAGWVRMESFRRLTESEK